MKFDTSISESEKIAEQVQDNGKEKNTFYKDKRNEMWQMYNDMLGYTLESSDRLKTILNISAKYPAEDLKNVILIAAQRPDTVLIQSAYHLKKNKVKLPSPEKAIWIFRPSKKGFPLPNGDMKFYDDPKEYYDVQDLDIILDSREISREYDPVTTAIFHSYHTEEEKGSVNFAFTEVQNAPAQYDFDTNTVSIRRDASPADRCEGIILSLCQRDMYQHQKCARQWSKPDYFVGYAATYLVCRKLCLPTEDFDFPPESWTAQTGKALAAQLHTVLETASHLTEKILPELERAERESKPVPAAEVPNQEKEM